MTQLKYYLIFVVMIALLKLCTMYIPYLVNALYMPNDELGAFLVESGFPIDSSSLEHVQKLVALLKQTRVSNPVYVDILFGVNFIHRQMLPPMNLDFVLSFTVTGLSTILFTHYYEIVYNSHEFYMNAMASALYGPVWGITVCCFLASISAAMWFPLMWILHKTIVVRALIRYYRIEPLRNDPDNLDGIEPAAAANAQATPQVQGWAQFIRAFLWLFFGSLCSRALVQCPSWGVNILAPMLLPRMYPFVQYWVLFVAWISAAATSKVAFAWYSGASVGSRLDQLATIDGVLNNWLFYVATFCCITYILTIHVRPLLVIRAGGEEDEDEDNDDEEDENNED